MLTTIHQTVELAAATVIANRMPGPPVWLAVVGPEDSGKSMVIDSLTGLREVVSLDFVTHTSLPDVVKKLRPGGTYLFKEIAPWRRNTTQKEVLARLLEC